MDFLQYGRIIHSLDFFVKIITYTYICLINKILNKMDKAMRKMRVVVPDREKREKGFLRNEAGWDGKFPIPVSYFGGSRVEELSEEVLNLIHVSADDHCIWVGDAISAAFLYRRGHNLVMDQAVLVKRKTFKNWFYLDFPWYLKMSAIGLPVAFS